jgi:hypothetical protein
MPTVKFEKGCVIMEYNDSICGGGEAAGRGSGNAISFFYRARSFSETFRLDY